MDNPKTGEVKLEVDKLDTSKAEEEEAKIGKGNKCPHCGVGFSSHELLLEYLENTGIKRGGCRKLWIKKNKEDVKAGILKHVCQECGIGFNMSSQLEVHKKFHSKDRPYKCTECDKEYKTRFNLNEHMRDRHSGEHTCPECGKVFASKRNMQQHVKNVCTVEEGKFKCTECGESFKFSQNLKTHIKVVHEGLRPFICDVCGSDFTTKVYLYQHKRRVHENTRVHKCEYCDTAFRTAAQLKSHTIRMHTFDWPHICQVCDKGFVNKSELRNHMEKHHPMEQQE